MKRYMERLLRGRTDRFGVQPHHVLTGVFFKNHLLQKWDELLLFIKWFGSLALIKIPIS